MKTKRIQRFSKWLGILVVALGAATLSPKANAAEATTSLQPLQEFKIAHCCHTHPLPPFGGYCCHQAGYAVPVHVVAPRVYVAPVVGVGPASVRGVSRRTSRRTSRRVGRRR